MYETPEMEITMFDVNAETVSTSNPWDSDTPAPKE